MMPKSLSDFLGREGQSLSGPGRVCWQAPSNIALVKYWGKYPGQLPANPSLSLTLQGCHTRTEVRYRSLREPAGIPPFDIFLDGSPAPSFAPKVAVFLERITPYLPFLRELQLEIRTTNSFPHSSGIASSASGMAALALCLCSMEQELVPDRPEAEFRRKASFLARLGSGSAARSIDGPMVLWGQSEHYPESSDLYGIAYPDKVHPLFREFRDTVLLVDQGEKAVSSTVGHGLMEGHPFAGSRFEQAKAHLARLESILGAGDLEDFATLVESEALSLHAMMLTSNPSYILMRPATLSIISKIREFRQASGQPVCFTLDAGANVHVLYPDSAEGPVYDFIQSELLRECPEGGHIRDRAGNGALNCS